MTSPLAPLPAASGSFLLAWLLVALACGLDRLVGDPHGLLHPVQVMGWCISWLRGRAEAWAGDRPGALRLAGAAITVLLVVGSALAGWGLERLALARPALGLPLLLIGLASALAGGSLRRAVEHVLTALPDLPEARRRLAWIVGRDVSGLDEPEILRAAAETASENAVDGLFAPLFWMLVGAALWAWSLQQLGHGGPGSGPLAAGLGGDRQLLAGSLVRGPLLTGPWAPGPLALAWAFKASSTLDSMLGYRHGRLRWLGTAGARLDDGLTWLPCRLVALSLPLAAGQPAACRRWWRAALREGAADPSPNAGVSQAAYAHAAGVRLGGLNRYADGVRAKPLLAADQPPAGRVAVERILGLSDRLLLLWLLVSGGLALLLTLAA